MNGFTHSKVWVTAVSLSALVFAGSLRALADTAGSGDEKKADEEKVDLPEFTVLGSRVPRVDAETPAPLVRITAAQIEEHGYTNLGDFVQSLSFNSSFANSIYQTASFTRGASTINPRGLGSNRFLTLVNGRRGVTYGLVNNLGQSVFDYNSIPVAAIESIEFLKDGASALYGADAVSGVLNVNLKERFTGLATEFFYGNTTGHDTGNTAASVTLGGSDAKTSYLAVVSFHTANSNFLHDFGVTTTDYTQSMGVIKGTNQNSASNYPANFTLTRAQVANINAALGNPAAVVFPTQVASSVNSWTFVPTGGALQGTPVVSGFAAAPSSATNINAADIPAANRYNFAETYQRYPSYDYVSGYTHVTRELSGHVQAFGDIAFSENRTYFAFTPVVVNFAGEGLTLPASNPYNPFGIALTSLSFRSNFGPVRKFDVSSHAAAFVGGLKGDFGGVSVLEDLRWEVGASYGYDRVTSISRNAIRATAMQAALNGTTRDTALNPFGPSDNPTVIEGLFTNSNNNFLSDGLAFDATVTGQVAHLPAGRLGLAAGVERRQESLRTDPDTSSYIGAGGGSPLSGGRTVTSEFVELTAPVLRDVGVVKNIEVQLAGRHEEYSDFGGTTKPKYAAKIRLADNAVANLVLRGSYSESFHAPDLGRLYATRTVSVSQSQIQDPLRPQDPPERLRTVTGGNPDLLPETARMSYAGLVVEIPAIKELSCSIDFFDARINQVIVTPSSTFLFSAAGLVQFPNAIVRDNSAGFPGPILRVETVPQNNPAAFQKYRGVDLGVKYVLRDTALGTFECEADATRVFELGTDSGLGGGYIDSTGAYNIPKWRGSASVRWSKGRWGAAVVADTIGGYFNNAFTAASWGENPYTTVHPSITYKGLWDSKITLGANNVFDHLPPDNGRFADGYDPNTYGAGALGRFVYVRVRHDF